MLKKSAIHNCAYLDLSWSRVFPKINIVSIPHIISPLELSVGYLSDNWITIKWRLYQRHSTKKFWTIIFNCLYGSLRMCLLNI